MAGQNSSAELIFLIPSEEASERGFKNQEPEKQDPYIRMLGGEFIRHGGQQKAWMRVTEIMSTGLVTVTCDALSNSQCVSWEIVPNANAPNANIANLYWYRSSKGTATWVYIGQYYNTFRIDVTNP